MTSKTETRLRDLGIGVGWTHPFFLPPLARITILEDANTPTMSVTLDGKVRVNPEWTASLSDGEAAGVLFHELLHLMMDHAGRMEERTLIAEFKDDKGNVRRVPLWNIAADMAINQVLKEMGLRLPGAACFPPHGDEGLNAEQLYEKLAKNSKKKDGGGGGTGIAGATGEAGSGCGVEPSDGQAADGEKDEQGMSAEDWRDEWNKVSAQARALAAGTTAGDALARLFARRRTMSWAQVCRACVSRAVAQHGRDDQTWTRRSRRSPPGILLPGWKATKATVAVVIDSSGSVTDDMLTQAIDEVTAIAKAAETRLYLVVHDYGVQTKGWVKGNSRERVHGRVKGRGGTSFDEAYQAIEAVGRPFDAMIHLTDGEIGNAWPARPRNVKRLVAAMLNRSQYRSAPPSGTLVVEIKV
jgi:predicted metal-dependent peptidase